MSVGTRPAHARTSETGLERLDFALGGTRANRIRRFGEFLIRHAALMGMEIMSEGSKVSKFERVGDGLKIAMKKAVLVVGEPAGSRIGVIREEGGGGI